MQTEIAKFLHDAKEAADRLLEFTRDKSIAEYEVDPILQAAVERKFITIGEALSQAAKIDHSVKASISALPQIIAFRNILVHAYSVVDNEAVWGIIDNDIAQLLRDLSGLLDESQ